MNKKSCLRNNSLHSSSNDSIVSLKIFFFVIVLGCCCSLLDGTDGFILPSSSSSSPFHQKQQQHFHNNGSHKNQRPLLFLVREGRRNSRRQIMTVSSTSSSSTTRTLANQTTISSTTTLLFDEEEGKLIQQPVGDTETIIDLPSDMTNTMGGADTTTTMEAEDTATVAVPTAEELQPPDWVSLWKRRLITHEDPYSIHKISSIVYTLTGFGILGVGAYQFFITNKFEIIPQGLEIPTHIFFITNLIMSFVSVKMAFEHRKFDITARNGFLGVAVVSMFSSFFMEWVSPFPAADIFNNLFISRSCFAFFVFLSTYFVADTVSKTTEVIEGRRDKKAEDYEGRVAIDSIGYVLLPVAGGLPPIILTALIQSVLHDRIWYQSQCDFIWDTTGVPFHSHAYYLQVLGSMAASQGALFITLRDKKLISKWVEWVGITIFALPDFIWMVYATIIFVQSMLATPATMS